MAIKEYLDRVGPAYCAWVRSKSPVPPEGVWSYDLSSTLAEVNENEGDLVLGVLAAEMLISKFGDALAAHHLPVRAHLPSKCHISHLIHPPLDTL